ncbi:MAG: hypothetical protein JSW06_02910 [Thermoplasmatales archaeon]|nr:MAG: hypothetical protein JSW06_02910 [Thermoplasmatales archaeon]
MKKITVESVYIEKDGVKTIDIIDQKDVKRLDEWSSGYQSGQRIQVTYEAIDKAVHFQYKYYYGYLLPDVMDAQGEPSQIECNLIIKTELLRKDLMSGMENYKRKYFNIPVIVFLNGKAYGYLPKGINLLEKTPLDALQACFTGEITLDYFTGTTILYIIRESNDNAGASYMYHSFIPSLSTLSYKEMKEHILNTENFLIHYIPGGRFSEKTIEIRGELYESS